MKITNCEEVKQLSDALLKNMSVVIRGKDEVIKKVVVSLLSGGHILLEDIPGTGKTTLAKALSQSVSFLAIFENGDVLADFVQAAQRNNFQFFSQFVVILLS